MTTGFKAIEDRIEFNIRPGDITRSLDILNKGADAKHGITITIFEQSGIIGSYILDDNFPISDAGKKYNLSTLNKKITKMALMFRGQDGIGRYLQTINSSPGKYFSTIACWWVTLPGGDNRVEEHFFSGEEALL